MLYGDDDDDGDDDITRTDLCNDACPSQFLTSTKQHEPRKDVGRHDVEIAEELSKQLGDLSERVLHHHTDAVIAALS